MYAKIKLRDQSLPDYTRSEELTNMATHIAGGAMGIVVLILCIARAARNGNIYGITASAIYGAAMIGTFTISSVYHGLLPCFGKKVM